MTLLVIQAKDGAAIPLSERRFTLTRDLIACENGLLHVSTRRLTPHNPALFNTYHVPLRYEPTASKPKRWWSSSKRYGATTLSRSAHCRRWPATCCPRGYQPSKERPAVRGSTIGQGHNRTDPAPLLGAPNVAGCRFDHGVAGSEFGLAPRFNASVGIVAEARMSAKTDKASLLRGCCRSQERTCFL
ncbi:MAG: hypothetical protein ACRDZO_06290 [Egibacteraceae bacterium]